VPGVPEGLPTDALSAGIGAGGLALAYLVWRVIVDTFKLRVESRKTTDEAETARRLGDKAMAEARSAGVTELASILGQVRAELDAQQAVNRRWSTAVLDFIGVVTRELSEMSPDVRDRIQVALDRLRSAVGWVGFGDGR